MNLSTEIAVDKDDRDSRDDRDDLVNAISRACTDLRSIIITLNPCETS